MDSDKLKKMLAGISIASLIAGVSIVVSCDGDGKSAWAGKKDAGSVQKDEAKKDTETKKGKSAWGGK